LYHRYNEVEMVVGSDESYFARFEAVREVGLYNLKSVDP
jgi:hypothetical protein